MSVLREGKGILPRRYSHWCRAGAAGQSRYPIIRPPSQLTGALVVAQPSRADKMRRVTEIRFDHMLGLTTHATRKQA